jgi:hypothetical protein
VKVDRHVEAALRQRAAERDVGQQPADARATRRDDDVGQKRVSGDHRQCRRFDQIRDRRGGKPVFQSGDRRGGENNVADLAETNEEDLQNAKGRTENSKTQQLKTPTAKFKTQNSKFKNRREAAKRKGQNADRQNSERERRNTKSKL